MVCMKLVDEIRVRRLDIIENRSLDIIKIRVTQPDFALGCVWPWVKKFVFFIYLLFNLFLLLFIDYIALFFIILL